MTDKPADLPDADIVHRQLVDGIVSVNDDELDDEDRAELHGQLEVSFAEADAGHTEDFAKLLAELRQHL